jgi:hypothetical protein
VEKTDVVWDNKAKLFHHSDNPGDMKVYDTVVINYLKEKKSIYRADKKSSQSFLLQTFVLRVSDEFIQDRLRKGNEISSKNRLCG